MTLLRHNPSRVDVFQFISRAATYGNLGLFIGAGLSKAVLNDKTTEIALSWGQLLEKASQSLGVDYSTISKEGLGYPQIATFICQDYAQVSGMSFRGRRHEVENDGCGANFMVPE